MKQSLPLLLSLTAVSALLALTGCSTSSRSYNGAVTCASGSTPCVGSYTAFAIITNSATGDIWFTPPNGTTNCTITDISGLGSTYVSVVKAFRKDTLAWCGTNTVTFPASSLKQYRFYIYVENTPPPPTNGDVLTLDVQWQP